MRLFNPKSRTSGPWRSAAHTCVFVCLALILAACQSPMRTPLRPIAAGDYTAARLEIRKDMTDDARDRRYLLDRMRVGVLTLADGYPESANTVFEEVYEVLRAQGINRDRTVQSIVLNEDIKIWKGEPFEQALALAYYGMVQAELGSWDNARAAADNALFYLKDFGEDQTGKRLDTEAIARRSLIYERAIEAGATPEEAMAQVDRRGSAGGDYLDHGYVARKSNFTLGYLLNGIANQQLGRAEEASDNLNYVATINPALRPLADAILAGNYNTVLVVSWGLGPEKVGYGPDNALARFVPRSPSDELELYVRVGDMGSRLYPVVLDVNRMAADHMWNNMEDVRRAKSTIGTALLYGGLITTAIGADHSNDTVALAGLGAMAAGAFLKAGAHVDVRYADTFPQRFYLVPLRLPDTPTPIELQVHGHPGSRIILTGLSAPRGSEAQLRYVRLISAPRWMEGPPPAWAVSGQIHYTTRYADATSAAEPALPYILGGNDIRTPTERVLDEYQDAGFLHGLTLGDLRELYRGEGIKWREPGEGGYVGRHVLEGGKWLVTPLPGTVGFTRLVGQRRGPYGPRTERVAELMEASRRPDPSVARR